MAEIKFYQDKEHEIQIYPEINPQGNYPGVSVGLADNLSSSGGITDTDTWQYRSSGGELDISDGYASLKKITGNLESTTITEKCVCNVRATGVTAATVTASTFKTKVSESGTYNFIYTPVISWNSSLVYTLNKSTFANYVNKTTGTYTFTYANDVTREDITNIINTFNESTFISKVGTPGSYMFTYNGSNWQLDNVNVTLSQYGISTKGTETSGSSFTIIYAKTWKLNNSAVTMANYGITTTGTESVGDTIAINYTGNNWYLGDGAVTLSQYGITITAGTAAIDDIIQIVYVAEQVGAIVVANPTELFSVGMNQFNIDGENILNGYIINQNGTISTSSGNYIIWFKALEGEVYTIYNATASTVGRIGYSADPLTTSSTVTVLSNETSSEWADELINDSHKKHVKITNPGYICVSTSNIEDLCCHLTWEAVNDDVYESYYEASLEIPYKDANGNTISEYGIAYLENANMICKDEIDLENHKFNKGTARMAYSAANLATVQAMKINNQSVPYSYDTNWIYYGVETVTHDLAETSNSYLVSNYGTEEFLDSDIDLQDVTIFYQDNLKDKLRFSVEVIDNKVEEISRDEVNTDYYKNMYPSVGAVLDFDMALRRILGIDVDTYSDTDTYAVGDYVIYDLKLWKCVTAVSSADLWENNMNWITEVSKVNVKDYETSTVIDYVNGKCEGIRTARRDLNIDRDGTNSYLVTVVCYEEDGETYHQASQETLSTSEVESLIGVEFNSDASGNKFLIKVTDHWIESYLFSAE